MSRHRTVGISLGIRSPQEEGPMLHNAPHSNPTGHPAGPPDIALKGNVQPDVGSPDPKHQHHSGTLPGQQCRDSQTHRGRKTGRGPLASRAPGLTVVLYHALGPHHHPADPSAPDLCQTRTRSEALPTASSP